MSRRAPASIEVVGVGGAGGTAVNRMIVAGPRGVDFIAVDSDLQALGRCRAGAELHVGRDLVHGLGAGGDRTKGRAAAEASREQVAGLIGVADLVLVTAGMGGGTGSGASAVVAEVARAAGALTIGVVTRPFRFEGKVRNETAAAGIQDLRGAADAVIVVPNDRLSQVVDGKTTLADAFGIADDVLRQGVRAIADLLVSPGVLEVELADVRAVMAGGGEALLGIGRGSGDTRADVAARQAVACPMLEASIDCAHGIVCCVTGGQDLTRRECATVAEIVKAAADPDARVVVGSALDARMRGEIRIALVATMLHRRQPPGPEPPWPSGVPSRPRPRTDGRGALAWPELKL